LAESVSARKVIIVRGGYLYARGWESPGMQGCVMNMIRRLPTAVFSLALGLMMAANVSAFPPATWHDGDEAAMFGHTFAEEYWTNSSIEAQTPAGDNVTFSASYVNYEDVQAFLLCLKVIENVNGTGTVPFQLFGMHYTTPNGQEVFVGAELAFLMVFNDSYNGSGPGQNGLPDPGHEDVLYVIPFGAAPVVGGSYVPEVNVHSVQKLGPGHFKFGIQYLNLYAFVSPNFLASALLRTGWIAKFSELTVDDEITMDNATGEVKTEAWYTIGEVTELWGVILGIPIPGNPRDIPDTMGISAVHFVTVFTSKYQGAAGNTTGNTLNPDITAPLNQDILLKVGNSGERAMKIGTRGTFDLINESSGLAVRSDQPALNAIVSAKAVDMLLVAWQLGFGAGAMSVFAYALSDYVQSKYTGPLDLAERSLLPANNDGFNAYPLWYAVSFPRWDGYRVVHDPVYTAYTDMNGAESPSNVGGVIVLLVIIVAVVVVAVLLATRRKGK
jgi:hypothetical protein